MAAFRVCAEVNCPRVQRAARCAEHRRERDRKRGTRQDRGYDADHDALGRDFQQQMDAGTRFRCWRCTAPLGVRRGIDWVLGHCDINRLVYHGPECPSCNSRTAGRTGCPHSSHM